MDRILDDGTCVGCWFDGLTARGRCIAIGLLSDIPLITKYIFVYLHDPSGSIYLSVTERELGIHMLARWVREWSVPRFPAGLTIILMIQLCCSCNATSLSTCLWVAHSLFEIHSGDQYLLPYQSVCCPCRICLLDCTCSWS